MMTMTSGTGLIAACLLLSLTAPAEARKARTGIGDTPAFICLTTTIVEGGTTRMSKVSRPSGNAQRDNAALRFARTLRFTAPDGGRYEGGEREVTLLVRMHQNGRHAWRSFEADEALPEICSTPAEP